MYTEGGGPVFECAVEFTLGVQLLEIACLTEKPIQCTLNWHLLQVVGAFYKDPRLFSVKKVKSKNTFDYDYDFVTSSFTTLIPGR